MSELNEEMRRCAADVERALAAAIPQPNGRVRVVPDACAYSALDGGKRIRPFLVRTVCRMLGGTAEAAMPFAAALEMIHCYSLIHDDLPCMDDDDFRRGRPSNHKVYGEAMALLAGDALLTKAFGTAAGNPYVRPDLALRAVRLLSDRAGEAGMIGGQELDLLGEKQAPDFPTLLELQDKKTGALIRAAAELGACAAGCEQEEILDRLRDYAGKIGLVFQIVDDILDVEGDAALLGKPVGSDAASGKTTFLSFYPIPDAKAYAADLTEKAKEAISVFEGPDAVLLTELADSLLRRKA